MKSHIEIRIWLNLNRRTKLHDVLRRFARNTNGWSFPVQASNDYQVRHRSSAGFVDCEAVNGLKHAGVAIANTDAKYPTALRVTNIVPKECSQLTVDEYNTIGAAFAEQFGSWVRKTGIGRVETVGPNKTLKDIIGGDKTRQMFESWLYTPSPLSHPSDLYALNCFICHLFRHPGKVRTCEIESYLVHDLGWSAEAARLAVVKIESGLELLRVDRKF